MGMIIMEPSNLWSLVNYPRILKFIYLSNVRVWLLDHLTPSLSVPTDDVVIESSALEQVVAIHSGMDAEWVGLVSSQVKPVEVYSLKVISGGWMKVGNSLGSLQVPRV
ncbi:uncharacterized protein TNCV_4136571 [Trichonephila clavipes]|nr:uncharacterized protein TNCV_4136571 [Trichonephila clavipes]